MESIKPAIDIGTEIILYDEGGNHSIYKVQKIYVGCSPSSGSWDVFFDCKVNNEEDGTNKDTIPYFLIESLFRDGQMYFPGQEHIGAKLREIRRKQAKENEARFSKIS